MLRILLVEDDAPVRRALASTIRREGHDVIEVGTAHEAKWMLAGYRFDLAIVDWNLGTPTSGSDVIKSALRRGVPCFMASAYPKDFILERWKEQNPLSGVLEFLSKPIELDGPEGLIALLERIERSKENTPPQGTRLP